MHEVEHKVFVFQLNDIQSIEAFFPVLADDVIYDYIPAPSPLDLADFVKRHGLMCTRRSLGAYSDSARTIPIGLLELDIQSAGVAKIGFMIGRAYWRQGVATQFVAQVISLLDPSIKTLIATVDSENIGSIKALEKNQFVRCGTKLGMLKWRPATEYSYQLNR